jgi:hypothetical protein
MVYFRRPDFQALRDRGIPVSKTVEVKATLDPPYRFSIKETKFDTADSPFKVEIVPVLDGREYRLVVRIDEIPTDPDRKSLKGNLTIFTDDPAIPEINIRIVAFL